MPTISRLSSLAARFNRVRSGCAKAPARFVGIDVGIRHASVVSLVVDKRSLTQKSQPANLRWRSSHKVQIGVDPTSAPSPEWISTTVEALLNGLPRCVDGENILAFISLPVPWIHYQVIAGRDIEGCRVQCDEMFLQSVFQSDAHLSYWPVVGLQFGEPNEDDQFVVGAIAKRAACQIAETVANAGYNLHSILPHGVALIQAAESLTGMEPRAVAMINRDGGCIAVNNLSGCGLCRPLPAIPVQILRQAGNKPLILDEVRPWLSDVAAEITATIRFSERTNMVDQKDSPVLICGEACQIPGLDEIIAKLTNQPVARWQFNSLRRPNRRLSASTTRIAPDPTLSADDTHYALALSLAHQAAATAYGEAKA